MARFELLRPGQVVDRYQVLSELGRGGMAAVYAVRRSSAGGVDKVLALKLLLPHLRAEERFVQLFFEEARVAARFDSAYLPQVFESGTVDGAPYLVMERLVGVPLATVLATEVERPTLLEIFAQIADALDSLHSRPGGLAVIHRDVSPENVFVGHDGHVRLLDLGVARALDRDTLTRTGEVRGKLRYLAPELVTQAAKLSPKVDVWAFGVMLWEALSERALFKSEDEAATLWNLTSLEVPELVSLDINISSEVSALVARCLVRDPEERPNATWVAERIRAHKPHCTPATVALMVAEQFGSELKAEQQQVELACQKYPRVTAATAEAADERTATANRPHRSWTNIALIALIGAVTVAVLLLTNEHGSEPIESTEPVQTREPASLPRPEQGAPTSSVASAAPVAARAAASPSAAGPPAVNSAAPTAGQGSTTATPVLPKKSRPTTAKASAPTTSAPSPEETSDPSRKPSAPLLENPY